MGSTTLQPRLGEDKYPLGRFILNHARALGVSRTDLVRRLGYRDIAGGHRALSTTLLTGVVAPQIADHLVSALEADETLVAAVVCATRLQRDDEASRLRIEREQVYSESFRPHIQVKTERTVPSPIFIAALLTVARLRIIRLPDEAIAAEGETRDRIVKSIILDHWRETGGDVPAFGAITGYVLVLIAGYGAFDFGLPYSVTGDPAGRMQKVQRLGEATLGTKRGDTRLTGLLKNEPIQVIQAGEDSGS
jgi:hypothetical protein